MLENVCDHLYTGLVRGKEISTRLVIGLTLEELLFKPPIKACVVLDF